LTAGAGRGRSTLGLTLAAGAAFLILLALGSWQLERRSWKTEIIAQREAALAAPPADIAVPQFQPTEFARIQATGRFAHEKSLYLTAQTLGDRVGYHIVTPLLLADGSALLVDRGFVPAEAKDPLRRAAGNPTGEVTVEGILRYSTPAGWFTPANQPAQNVWFRRDSAEMAAATGLGGTRPFFLLAGTAPNPGGLPIGTKERIEIRNDHLQYAITWYALAAALAAIYVALLRETRERRTA
jgi:surfeit locus 1 family protein